MKKWNSKYMNIITPCFFVVFAIIVTPLMNKRDAYIEANGVWTVYELGPVNYAPKGGLTAPIFYKYGGENYRAGTGVADEIGLKGKGRRFFMMLMPEKPAKKIVLYSRYPVPSWFTLDAPSEGWPTKPTEAELREMMVQDSLKRGLITNTAVPPYDL